eukprot:625575-Pyramimonas_sp.AAC.1
MCPPGRRPGRSSPPLVRPGEPPDPVESHTRRSNGRSGPSIYRRHETLRCRHSHLQQAAGLVLVQQVVVSGHVQVVLLLIRNHVVDELTEVHVPPAS